MNFSLRIAWRYIFSKKSTNAINMIAGVSMLGIVVGSAALIIVLSAFNGFEGLVEQLYVSFYPDVTVSLKQGKVFRPDTIDLPALRNLEGVDRISKVLEENALLIYEDQEHIATFKGVDSNFVDVNAVDDSVFIGRYALQAKYLDREVDCGVLGAGVAAVLNISLGPNKDPIDVYMPRRGKTSSLGQMRAFRKARLYAVGVFRIQQDFDSRYVIASLPFMQELLNYKKGQISQLEIKLEKGADVGEVMDGMRAILGPDFKVQDRYHQNEFVYKVMRSEKWAVYAVLTFILIVAAFNMIGSISMLAIEKKRDIGVLQSMGADRSLIQRIFLFEGLMQSMISLAIGFAIALALVLIQIYFEPIKIPGSGTFVVSAYPVKLQAADFGLVFLTILLIGGLASWFPARKAASYKYIFKED